MTTALLFPGQGSQRPGMGEAFVEAWPEADRAFDRLARAFDDEVDTAGDGTASGDPAGGAGGDRGDLRRLCFGGDREELRRTENTQPAVYAVGVAVAEAIARRYDPDVEAVAGHSLGQFTAAAHAGLYDPVEGLSVVTRRGAAMAAAGREHPGGPGRMTAVLLADPDLVTDVCESVAGASVAAYNTPRQTVVSGREEAVETVRERIEERGRARFVDLEVGAAFHSPVMEPAVDAVMAAVEDATMTETNLPVVSDVSAAAYTGPRTARSEMAAQVRSPVDWRGVVERLSDRGVDRYVELPPAGTLSEFVERIDRDATVHAIEEPADAAEVFGE